MQSPLLLSSKVPQFPGNGIWHFQQVLPSAPVVHPQLWSMMRNDKLGEYQRSALCVYTHMPYLEGAICGNRWILGHYPDECLLPSVSAEKAVPWKGSVTQRHINFLTSLQWQITRGTCLFPTCSAHARSPNPFKWTLLDDATSKHRHFILKNKPLGIDNRYESIFITSSPLFYYSAWDIERSNNDCIFAAGELCENGTTTL